MMKVSTLLPYQHDEVILSIYQQHK